MVKKMADVDFANPKKVVLWPLITLAVFSLLIGLAVYNYYSEQVALAPEIAAGGKVEMPLMIKIDPSYLAARAGYSMNAFTAPPSGKVILDVSSLNIEQRSFISNSLKQQGLEQSNIEGNFIKLDLGRGVSGDIVLDDRGISFFERAQSYIVEFKEEPVIDKKKVLEEEIARLEAERAAEEEAKKPLFIQNYRQGLEDEHENAISDLKRRLGTSFTGRVIAKITGDAISNSEPAISKEFYNVFNGIVLENISVRDIEKIKKSPYVKDVYPNRKVRTFLMDSVPLIDADNVWQLQDEYGKNITGQDIKIAIIDTGVDYTHPDLGGCLGEGCKVAGGYDFVNNDADPMDDMGHGTHVAATAAGKNPYAEEQIPSPPPSKESLFKFMTDGSYSGRIGLNITDGYVEFNLIYGNGTDFLGTGKDETSRLAVSDTNEIILNATSDKWFVVSSFAVTEESYLFELKSVDSQYPIKNTTTIMNAVTNVEYALDVGETESIGPINIRLNAADADINIVNISISSAIGEDVAFNAISYINGNSLNLPSANNFPTNQSKFDVWGVEGSVIQTAEFYWNENQEISLISSGGVGGGGGGSEESKRGLNGVAPDAKIYAYKVLDSGGSGTWSTVISGIERAIDPNNDGDFSDRADIISMSLGGYGNPDDPVSSAVDGAVDAGVVAVIAAGNSGSGERTIGSPGTARKAITIGASDKNDTLASFSSRGPVMWANGSINKPDVVAPGVMICAAEWNGAWSDKKCFDDKHVAISGTSMATPHVAGLVALIKQKYPNLKPEEIKNLIKMTAKDIRYKFNPEDESIEDRGYKINDQGSGRVSALDAVNSRIVIEGDLEFGKMMPGQTGATKNITIKNLQNQDLSIQISSGSATNENGVEIYPLSISENFFTVPAGGEKEIQVGLDFPLDYDGLFGGKINVYDFQNTYYLAYSFLRYSELILEVEGDHYPNFYLHDENLDQMYGFSQWGDFEGNSVNIGVVSGNYTVYAINDFVNPSAPIAYPETDEYVLIDRIEIPIDAVVSKTFRLSDGKKVVVKARDKEGNPLELYEWTREVATYKNKTVGCNEYGASKEQCENNPNNLICRWIDNYYCADVVFNLGFYDPSFGDKEIYITNKPDNGLETDMLFKYIGASQSE